MIPEEFYEELEYFARHYDDYNHGDYKPLWKQRQETGEMK